MRPAVRLPVDEWCEKNVHLVDGRTPRFSLVQAPWQREPLRALASNRNREVVLVWPTGCGKSVMFEAWINWIVSEDPGPLICAHQTKDPSQTWVEGRVLPTLRKSPTIRELVAKMRTRRQEGEVVMPHMRLNFGGANKRFLQDHSKRYVLGQEVWDWTPGMVSEIKARTHDRFNRREVYCGQGGTVGGDFETEWNVCLQHEWHYRCPKCETLQRYDWERMRWDEDLAAEDEVDWKALGESTWYECECGARFEDDEVVRRKLTTSGEYVSRGNKHKPRHVGFTMNAMAIWWIEWGQLVCQFIEAERAEAMGDRTKMVAFRNKRLALFDEEKSETPEVTPGDYSREEYAPVQSEAGEWTRPEWVDEAFRFLTVDVQKRHFWAKVRCWKLDGSSRLVFEGKVSTIEGVRDLQMRYGVSNWCVGIDSRYRPDLVAEWRLRYAGRDGSGKPDLNDAWTMLMGEDTEGCPVQVPRVVDGKKVMVSVLRPFSKWVQGRTAQGVPYQFIKFSNLRIKDLLAGMMGAEGAGFEVMSDPSPDYVKHMKSEVCRELKGGKRQWQKIKDHYRNDLWDCECMGLVLACVKGLLAVELETAGGRGG